MSICYEEPSRVAGFGRKLDYPKLGIARCASVHILCINNTAFRGRGIVCSFFVAIVLDRASRALA